MRGLSLRVVSVRGLRAVGARIGVLALRAIRFGARGVALDLRLRAARPAFGGGIGGGRGFFLAPMRRPDLRLRRASSSATGCAFTLPSAGFSSARLFAARPLRSAASLRPAALRARRFRPARSAARLSAASGRAVSPTGATVAVSALAAASVATGAAATATAAATTGAATGCGTAASTVTAGTAAAASVVTGLRGVDLGVGGFDDGCRFRRRPALRCLQPACGGVRRGLGFGACRPDRGGSPLASSARCDGAGRSALFGFIRFRLVFRRGCPEHCVSSMASNGGLSSRPCEEPEACLAL